MIDPTPEFRRVAPAALPRPRRLLPAARRAIDLESVVNEAERRVRERPLGAAFLALALGIVVGKIIR